MPVVALARAGTPAQKEKTAAALCAPAVDWASKKKIADAGGIVGWERPGTPSPPPRGSPLKERPKAAGIGLLTSAPLPSGKAKGDPQLQALIEKAERETRRISDGHADAIAAIRVKAKRQGRGRGPRTPWGPRA